MNILQICSHINTFHHLPCSGSCLGLFLSGTFVLPQRGKTASFAYAQDAALSGNEWAALACGSSLCPIIFEPGNRARSGSSDAPFETVPSHPLNIIDKDELVGFRANHDFSQWSLSIEGIPVERSDNTGTGMLFEQFLLEQKVRVQQPPKCERSLALKNRAERENPTGSFTYDNVDNTGD